MRALFALVLPLLCAAAACRTAPTASPRGGAQCAAEDDGCRVARLGEVHLGWLKPSLPLSDLATRLGAPETLDEPFEEAATGEMVQRASWPSAGVDVTLSLDAEGVAVVRDFTVTAPFAEKTGRGVALGSAEADVLAAYADCLEGASSVPGQTAVAGSIYGGVVFTFEGGVVTSIFVGAGAE